MMDRAKHQNNTTFFMEIFMIGAWITWKQRKDCIFNRGCPFQSWKQGFLQEAALQAHRMQPDKQHLFTSVFQLYRSLSLESGPLGPLYYSFTFFFFFSIYINKRPQQGASLAVFTFEKLITK
jgi:hypothetical protein